ncbi:MAG: DPP IV N-terminal domain-containing protein [Gemmatimonadota bacterium]
MAFRTRARSSRVAFLSLLLPAVLPAALSAQDRLKTMPGYERYVRMQPLIGSSVTLGTLGVTWATDGKSFDYAKDGKRWRYDVATKKTTEAPPAAATAGGRGGRGGGAPARGRQVASALSPDSTRKAFYRDRNLFVSDTSGRNEMAITSDGSETKRIKYGTASWVYGEELNQNTAMWWNPAGTAIAYYRFDESPVPDYYLGMDQTKVQATLDTEAYPKAGAPNPIVDLFVYDLATKQSMKIDVRDGKAFDNDVVGHYVYNVRWSPDGKAITFNRTNRRQNVMEFTACAPATGKCRVVVREEWKPSWTENIPEMRYLADGQRFVWESERTGFKHFYLYDMSGKLLSTLTKGEFEAANIVRVDEKANALYYMARDGANHMMMQLHRVGLDGKGDKRLTDPAFNHTVTMAPDGRFFVDVAQTHDKAPVTRLLDANGTIVSELAKSDTRKFDSLGLKTVELYTYKAADGVTTLHGMLHKPSNFDPSRKYPVLVTVYGGPATNGARETFTMPNPYTELGFIVLSLDSRSAAGRGKKFLDAIYGKLGTVEVDDQAEGVKALKDRPYVDLSRVGIFGTSYGGYASALALLRHPDVFQAASAMSAVTDWRNYDSIYTERYMWTPQENASGYDAGSAMKYADKLKGRLMLYFGTADNNVHPSNTMQLISALQRAGKSFEVQVGPDAGHTALTGSRMMEFFIENLVLKPTTAIQP